MIRFLSGQKPSRMLYIPLGCDLLLCSVITSTEMAPPCRQNPRSWLVLETMEYLLKVNNNTSIEVILTCLTATEGRRPEMSYSFDSPRSYFQSQKEKDRNSPALTSKVCWYHPEYILFSLMRSRLWCHPLLHGKLWIEMTSVFFQALQLVPQTHLQWLGYFPRLKDLR